MRSRPVEWRASCSAIRFASVPELVKRTCSIDGKRWQTSSASRISSTWVAPKLQPALERGVHRRRHWTGIVPEQAGRVVAEEVDVLEAVDVDEP